MLRDLFHRSFSCYEASPHAADLEGFAKWLVDQGYPLRPAQCKVRHLYRALTAAASEPIPAASLGELRSIFASMPAEGYVGTQRVFRRYLLEQGRLLPGITFEPRDALKQQYLQRLTKLRGLAPKTVSYIDWALTDFLTSVLTPHDSPSIITPQAIDEFFARRRRELARRTFYHTVGAVRSFLRYAFERGVLPRPLHLFELPKSFRFDQPPRALRWSDVQALLSSVDRSTPSGCRDHAILFLLAHYGLRPGEVASLALDSVNWEAGTLRVAQSKTRSTLMLPLSPEAKVILRGYIDRTRPPSRYQTIFLGLHPPHLPISAACISIRFKLHARRAGAPTADASAYALRHSFAMRLLACGVDIKCIGDLMGHHSIASTSAYLRAHVDMLREVGIDLSGNGGAQ
jgi:integrase/recombinase XerD